MIRKHSLTLCLRLFLILCSSGGKDSCYNMMQCVAAGHRIVALANLRPAHTGEEEEEEEEELLGGLAEIWASQLHVCTPGNSELCRIKPLHKVMY